QRTRPCPTLVAVPYATLFRSAKVKPARGHTARGHTARGHAAPGRVPQRPHTARHTPHRTPTPAREERMESRRIEFDGSLGAKLSARLELPEGGMPPRAHTLFAHCFTCSKDTPAAVKISRALAAKGIATLRFDFTGLGGSGGDFASTNFSSNVADLVQ